MNHSLPAFPHGSRRWSLSLLVLLPLLFAANVSAAPATQSALKPAPDTMEERAKPCVVCHTAEGRADKDAYYPRLAGKPAGYLFNQMRHFRDGRRTHRAMSLLMENLSDDFLRALAGYFATQPVLYAPPERTTSAAAPALVTNGDASRHIPGCASCHGRKLVGVAPAIPGLLGLPRDYISAQFGAWRVGTRVAAGPDCMGEIARQLSQTEVTAIADWLAAQPLPAGAHGAEPDGFDPEAAKSCGSVRDATADPATTAVKAAAGKKAVTP